MGIGCGLEVLPGAMDYWDGERERVKAICAVSIAYADDDLSRCTLVQFIEGGTSTERDFKNSINISFKRRLIKLPQLSSTDNLASFQWG